MSVQAKRHLANINDSLRSQHLNLKTTKDHLLDHIGGLLKQEKKLQRIKTELMDELVRAEERKTIEKKTKEPLCMFLKEELGQLDKKYIEGNLKIRNLENQYQNCLLDYEKVIEVVTGLVEGASGIEGEFGRLKQADITMKAMIFDCQRLKRVLEEEKRYFRELCHTEQKGHSERLKELESIHKNITKEEDSSTCSIRLSKLQIGLMKLGNFFSGKMTSHGDYFLRPQAKEIKLIKIGSKSIQNCVRIGSLKMLENKRGMFRTWHSKVFPMHILKDITERALVANQESRLKLKVLNTMEEKVLEKNTQLLHLFQKIKYVVGVANKCSRKDMHYGFNIWRDECREAKRLSNTLQSVFCRVIPTHLKRSYFSKWFRTSNYLKRVEIAAMLLEDFQSTKAMACGFRRWRLQLLNIQEKKVRFYMRRLADQDMITRRLNYEKRKEKILMMLHMKMQKIQLRNYFGKYLYNVKSMRVKEKEQAIEVERGHFSEARKDKLKTQNQYQTKDRKLMLLIFRDFVYKCKIVPVYKQWKNEAGHFKKQKRAVLSLVHRRQAKNKIYVMNQFRKCVQYYQKKEMHQILTDLNHKMQAINQKSTQFRESLKLCIDNLGVIASKKMDTVTNYVYNYQKKMVYNSYNAKRIKKAYRQMLLQRMLDILNCSCERQVMSAIRDHNKTNQRGIQLDKMAQKYAAGKEKARFKKIFYWLRRQAQAHHTGFKRLVHVENVFYFYRLAYSFAAVKRVYTAQKYIAMHKYLEDQGNVLVQSEQNLKNSTNTREGCQKDLLQFFGKFVTYEQRHRNIKMKEKTHGLLKQYLTKFRSNVHSMTSKELATQNLGAVLMNNHQMVFFRNLMIIRYEQLMQTVKQQLSKINKKRKTFDDKSQKIRGETLKKFEEELKVYRECKDYYQFYTKRYEDTLKYYSKRTVSNEEMFFKRRVFIEWKYQCKTVGKMIRALAKIYQRKFLREPAHLAIRELRGRINKARAQDMIAPMFERKGNRLKLDTISLWKVNIQKMKQWEIQKRLDSLDEYQEEMKDEIRERAWLISREVPRVDLKRLISRVFMGFKQIWLQKVTNRRKVQPMLLRRQQSRLRVAVMHWKWLIYYKHTKRAYLKYKKNKYNFQLKRDVFNSLKFERYSIYNVVNKIQMISGNQLFKMYHSCFEKIRNEAANQRDELNYERGRALFTILKGKVAKYDRIKSRVLWKWHAQLIARQHYLPSYVKRMELNSLKSAFALINQKKYWNEIYIKDIAEGVTQEGYNDVNQSTNSLMREGYDPDEIKDYLKVRNDKDLVILDGVVKHLRMWDRKEVAVRAFHSWKQFVVLKRKIKKGLTRVFNIAGGIGKYWSRWRTKDVHFNEILKKQSRGNMLNRFRELSRLLKQYHRDIRDNGANLEELQQINMEYKQKNKVALLMAINVFSNSVKRGMLQGFNLWRYKVQDQRRNLMDERYDQIISGLQLLNNQKSKLRYNMSFLRQQNKQLKEKCVWGVECGKILEKLLTQKDTLSIDLADKEHNMKLLLEDNLRLKQKMKLAQSHAERLIQKVEQQESINQ